MQRADPLGWVGATLESKYRIDAIVGEGGFGFVYRGTHLRLGKPIAVKFLRPDVAGDGERREKFLRRFETEGRLLYDLSRATLGVVQAHDLGIASSPRGVSTPFIVMEWLDGYTLSEELRMRPTRSVDQALELLGPVLDALVVAHEMGIVHRDLKPANLMLCSVGARTSMKVLDFGIAQVIGTEGERLAGSGATNTRFFSMAYGAPEQFDPSLGPTGPWTDVYAFGLTLIEVIDGRRPYVAEDMNARIEALNLESRPMLRADRSLDDVLRRVLAVDPRNRPRNAAELRELLRARHTTSTSSSREKPTTAIEVAPTARARSKNWWWLLAAGIPLIGLGINLLNWTRSELQPLPARQTEPHAETPPNDPTSQLARWNDAQTRQNMRSLESLYADHVCYYHNDFKPDEIIPWVRGFYSKPGAYQKVDLSSAKVIPRSLGRVRVEFPKAYSTGTVSGETRGYLILDSDLRIIAESDDENDHKLALEQLAAKRIRTDRCANTDAW